MPSARQDMKYIRDGLYGYIAISPIEDAILNHPSVLRLHRILQNSTLYQTYPFNRSSRFPHSLGTMHVAGKLLDALFLNSGDSETGKLIAATTRLIDLSRFRHDDIRRANAYIRRSQSPLDATLGNGSPPGDEFYARSRWKVAQEPITQGIPLLLDPNFVMNVLNQAVRLAAIVHDIGHLPYSHVIEFALHELETRSTQKIYQDSRFAKEMRALHGAYASTIEKYTSNRSELKGPRNGIHERIGLLLIAQIYNQEKDRKIKGDELQCLFDMSFALCISLICIDQFGHYMKETFSSLLKINPDFGYLYPLASIISGPVDCDRLDYLLRDAVNSGAPDFASFDQERILNHVLLATLPVDKNGSIASSSKAAEGHEILVPVFDRRAFSALSDFFYSRYRQFRWILSHHNVVRTDLALARLVLLLAVTHEGYQDETDILGSTVIDAQLQSQLEKLGFGRLLDLRCPSEKFRYVDDAWLDTFLQNLSRELTQTYPALTAPGSASAGCEVPAQSFPVSRAGRQARQYLEVVLERRTDRLQAIWKNEDRFKAFAEGFSEYACRLGPQPFGPFTPPNLAEALGPVTGVKEPPERLTNLILRVWWGARSPTTPYTAMLPIEHELNKGDRRIQFALKVFNPYDRVNIVQQNGTILPLEAMSNVIPRLSDIALEGLVLYAFDAGDPPEDWRADQSLRQLGTDVADIMLKQLEQLIKQARSGIASAG